MQNEKATSIKCVLAPDDSKFNTSAFSAPEINNNEQKLTLVSRYMMFKVGFGQDVTPEISVFRANESSPVPTWATSCPGCSDSIWPLFLNFPSWTIGTTWGYAGQLLNQYINQSNTIAEGE